MPVRETRRRRATTTARRHVTRLSVVRTPVPPPRDTAPRPAAPSTVSSSAAVEGAVSRAPRKVAVALIVVLAAALATLVVAGRQWYEHHRLDAAHQAALAAAKQTTVDFVSISAATVDRDLQRISAGATGDFKDEFTRGVSQVRTAVVENKVQSTGTVLRAALVSGDLDSAVVLVAVDASVKNAGAPDGRISHYRIQVSLALDAASGTWLVSSLQFVG